MSPTFSKSLCFIYTFLHWLYVCSKIKLSVSQSIPSNWYSKKNMILSIMQIFIFTLALYVFSFALYLYSRHMSHGKCVCSQSNQAYKLGSRLEKLVGVQTIKC